MAWPRLEQQRCPDLDRLELLALRTAHAAVRDGQSLEAAAQICLEGALQHLGLPFGCLYVTRHEHLVRMAAHGLPAPLRGATLLPLDEAAWAWRPFASPRDRAPAGSRLPDGLPDQPWLAWPLRLGNPLVGVLILGADGELPDEDALQRMTPALAAAVANAVRVEATRELLHETREIVFRADAEGRWTYLNDAWQQTFGEPVAAALGCTLEAHVAPEERHKVAEGLAALVPLGSLVGRQTLPFVVDDGSIRWMEVHARVLRDDHGARVGSAGVMRDVSLPVHQAQALATAGEELRRRAEELERANLELAEADRVKTEFLATVSHELKTPLSLILGFAEMLVDGTPDEPTLGQLDYLTIIREAGQHLDHMIGELLLLAKLEAGQVEVKAEPVDLAALLANLYPGWHDRALQAELKLRPPDVATARVMADPERLRQVLEALVDNALKFNRPGGSVRVSAQRLGPFRAASPDAADVPMAGHLQVIVADDGLGVAPEKMDRLFRKFVQADGTDTRRHGGLGVGLVLARALVELMGGKITLYSPGEGRGTTVSFTVPLAGECL
ncbi:MAG: PAS domain-containing sensor histidine kinase [Armatimonadetes bacterium]|nr:PAS domain-containing sensor histidine kinase [Armatimonadota bacterium]